MPVNTMRLDATGNANVAPDDDDDDDDELRSGVATPPPNSPDHNVAPLSPFISKEASEQPRNIQKEWARRPNHYTT